MPIRSKYGDIRTAYDYKEGFLAKELPTRAHVGYEENSKSLPVCERKSSGTASGFARGNCPFPNAECIAAGAESTLGWIKKGRCTNAGPPYTVDAFSCSTSSCVASDQTSFDGILKVLNKGDYYKQLVWTGGTTLAYLVPKSGENEFTYDPNDLSSTPQVWDKADKNCMCFSSGEAPFCSYKDEKTKEDCEAAKGTWITPFVPCNFYDAPPAFGDACQLDNKNLDCGGGSTECAWIPNPSPGGGMRPPPVARSGNCRCQDGWYKNLSTDGGFPCVQSSNADTQKCLQGNVDCVYDDDCYHAGCGSGKPWRCTSSHEYGDGRDGKCVVGCTSGSQAISDTVCSKMGYESSMCEPVPTGVYARPGRDSICRFNCEYGKFSDWSLCSRDCRGGIMKRTSSAVNNKYTNQCPDIVEQKPCNEDLDCCSLHLGHRDDPDYGCK